MILSVSSGVHMREFFEQINLLYFQLKRELALIVEMEEFLQLTLDLMVASTDCMLNSACRLAFIKQEAPKLRRPRGRFMSGSFFDEKGYEKRNV